MHVVPNEQWKQLKGVFCPRVLVVSRSLSHHSQRDEPAPSAVITCVSLRQLLLLCCGYKEDRDIMGPLACQSGGHFRSTETRRWEEEEERGGLNPTKPGLAPVAPALVQICYSYRGGLSHLWPAHIPTMHYSELHGTQLYYTAHYCTVMQCIAINCTILY